MMPRHQTERKLWNGDNLSTKDIVTNVQLFPAYRLAYTEKIFRIKNSRAAARRSRQEALYTFYLPEGSVVTSAALWVNGKEEPAYLTTKKQGRLCLPDYCGGGTARSIAVTLARRQSGGRSGFSLAPPKKTASSRSE